MSIASKDVADYLKSIKMIPSEMFAFENRVMITFLDTQYWWNNNDKYNRYLLKNKFSAKNVLNGKSQSSFAGTYRVLSAPLLNDVKFPNGITKFGDLIGTSGVFGAIDQINNVMGSLSGQAVGGFLKFRNLKTWKSTDPMTFQFTLHFDTETSALEDAVLPSYALYGYTLPEDSDDNKTMKVPGIAYTDLFSQATDTNQTPEQIEANKNKVNSVSSVQNTLISKNARLISIMIGNSIYFKVALLEEANITESKDLTESGYPLWVEVDCKVSSLETITSNALMEMLSGAKFETQTKPNTYDSTNFDNPDEFWRVTV